MGFYIEGGMAGKNGYKQIGLEAGGLITSILRYADNEKRKENVGLVLCLRFLTKSSSSR